MNIEDLDLIFKVVPEQNIGRNFFKKTIPIPKYSGFWEWYRIESNKDIFFSKNYKLQKNNENWSIYCQYDKPIKSMINKNSMDKFFTPQKIDLSSYGLYEYQIPHVQNLINGIKKFGRILDVSPPGMGKTICSLSMAAELKSPVIVICTKIHNWLNMINKIGCLCVMISTYDSLKNGHQLILSEKGKVKKIPQTFVHHRDITDEFSTRKFYWENLDPNIIFIIDEIHKAGNPNTINTELISSIAKLPNRIIGLSATIGQDPLHFYGAGRIMNMWDKDWEFYTQFLPNHFCSKRSYEGHDFWDYSGEQWGMLKIAAELQGKIFKMDITKVKRDFLFPNTRIIPEIIYSDNAEEFNKHWFKFKDATIVERQQILMSIELLKTEIMAEKAKILIEQDYAVVIFVNYTASLLRLGELLKTTCFYYGDISADLKEANRLSFENNTSPIIICNINAGGASIDLHDKYHKKSRISIISPCYSATSFLQSLGRIDRANGTDTIQYILFVGDTIESQVAESVKRKIGNLQALNDNDLTPITYL